MLNSIIKFSIEILDLYYYEYSKFENTNFQQFYHLRRSYETNILCQKYIDNPFLGSFALVNSGLIAVGNILDMNIL